MNSFKFQTRFRFTLNHKLAFARFYLRRSYSGAVQTTPLKFETRFRFRSEDKYQPNDDKYSVLEQDQD